MTSRHTPGPWRIGDAGFTVFGPPKPGALPETIAPVKNRANARLIAAAPDLLDVLAEMLADAEILAEPYRNEAICERARAVIARATGD